MQAAQPRYNHPFKVYLVHEALPNAFATPGGCIDVVDARLYFAKNKEELAGTLGRFDPDRQSATPFEAPKRAPGVFLRCTIR